MQSNYIEHNERIQRKRYVDVKWLILLVAIVVISVACLHYPNSVSNAGTEEKVTGQIVHTIRYDVINQKIISVTDENGVTVDKMVEVVNGIPVLLRGKRISRADTIPVLSTIASNGCTCYWGTCVGECQQ
jgi:hypothetical protein